MTKQTLLQKLYQQSETSLRNGDSESRRGYLELLSEAQSLARRKREELSDEHVQEVAISSKEQIDELIKQYGDRYTIPPVYKVSSEFTPSEDSQVSEEQLKVILNGFLAANADASIKTWMQFIKKQDLLYVNKKMAAELFFKHQQKK